MRGKGAPRFLVTEAEMKGMAEEYAFGGARPMDAETAGRAKDAIGHLIRALRGAEKEIERLQDKIDELESEIEAHQEME